MKSLLLSDMLELFPHAQQASLYRKIRAMPQARGVLCLETLAIGERYSRALMLYGPGCTFETWQAAEGVPVQGDTALTNPLQAQTFASIPDLYRSHPATLDHIIKREEALAYDELPRIWVGRKKKHSIWLNDIFFNPKIERGMKIITIGDVGNEFLVCPLEFFSEVKETDESSPNFGYRKHYDKWVWMSMPALFMEGYRVVTDKRGEAFAMLVADKKDERGIE